MGKSLQLVSDTLDTSIDLYSWLAGVDVDGFEAMAGITGFGFPNVANQWFEGAGDGSTYRGTRVLAKDIELPLRMQGKDRETLNNQISQLARMFDPENGPVQLVYGMPDDDIWYMSIRREGGGDWVRGVESNRNRWIKTVFSLRAGDPYWTRDRPEGFIVRQDTSGRGLLVGGYLAKMLLSRAAAFGSLTVENIGDAKAWPLWTITGPLDRITLTGARGEVIDWVGTLSGSQGLIIDAQAGTVVDFTGANRYDGLAPAPNFWPIRPGSSVVSVTGTGVTSGSAIQCSWKPRRWAVI